MKIAAPVIIVPTVGIHIRWSYILQITNMGQEDCQPFGGEKETACNLVLFFFTKAISSVKIMVLWIKIILE